MATDTQARPDARAGVSNLRAAFRIQLSPRLFHLISIAFIAVIALWYGHPWLRDDLTIFGDHPGTFFKAWYLTDVQFPQTHRLFGWNPYWYAGYPELQFYPPGYALLVLLVKSLSLGFLTTISAYELVVFFAYLLPGLSIYYALTKLGFDRRTGILGGLFGLIFPSIFGGYSAIVVGLVGSRLSFGLDGFTFALGITAVRERNARSVLLAGAVLGFQILCHMYHAIGILAGIGFYALLFGKPRVRALGTLSLFVAGALALDSFWLVPLLAHGDAAVQIVQYTLDQSVRQFSEPVSAAYWFFSAFAILLSIKWLARSQREIVWTLLLTGLTATALIFFGHLILVERLNIYRFDPIRFIGEYYFALIMLGAIGAGEFITRLSDFIAPRLRRFLSTRAALGIVDTVVAIAVVLAFMYPWGLVLFQFWKVFPEPTFLSEALREYKLDEFSQTLRGEPGRVLFTSFYGHLDAKQGPQPFDTTIKALTPYLSGREIVGGTFTHWSPIAADLWVGQSRPKVIHGIIENNDEQRLFGKAWESLKDDTLLTWSRRLNISTIVASVEDVKARTVLDQLPYLHSFYNNGLFFAYRVKDYQHAWVEATDAQVEPVSYTPNEIVFRVRHVASDRATATVKIFGYPLWHAYSSAGQALATTRDEWGLLQVSLPAGEDYTVTLRYEEGSAEQVGMMISGATLIGFGGVLFAVWRRMKRKRTPQASPSLISNSKSEI